jgi:hypothetical protein
MNELDKIKLELEEAKNTSIIDRYTLYKKVSCQLLNHTKNTESINLCKELMTSIYELRYEMAYNKATDSGIRDIELKEIWESLNNFV